MHRQRQIRHDSLRGQVYSSVGTKIKADLMSGNAVVLFAYGLSGSGKTFTVFGPDAVDEPEVARGAMPRRKQSTAPLYPTPERTGGSRHRPRKGASSFHSAVVPSE